MCQPAVQQLAQQLEAAAAAVASTVRVYSGLKKLVTAVAAAAAAVAAVAVGSCCSCTTKPVYTALCTTIIRAIDTAAIITAPVALHKRASEHERDYCAYLSSNLSISNCSATASHLSSVLMFSSLSTSSKLCTAQ
eukprot:14649-Heterococcus_DN1.PRE.2